MSRKGLEWILSCFADIWDWVPGKDYLYKRFRENNKFFEFQGRSNKAGIFVEIAVFYGGARRGCVMVPASSNRSGWCLFTKELDRFLSGSNSVWVDGRTAAEDVCGGLMDGGGQKGKKSFKIRNQRKLRNFEISRAISGHNVLKGGSGITVSSINGRPTREYTFELTLANLALRVSKSDGGKRVVTRLSPYYPHKSINSGPDMFPGHDKAQLTNPCGKVQEEVSFYRGLDVSWLRNQSAMVVGETSKPPMKSTVPPAMTETSTVVNTPISCSNHASKTLTDIPTSVLGALETGKVSVSRSSPTAGARVSGKAASPRCIDSDAEITLGLGNRGSGFTSETVVSSASATIEAPILNVVPPSLVQYPWVVQNRFSPLSDLGNGVEDVLVEGDDHEEVQRSNHEF